MKYSNLYGDRPYSPFLMREVVRSTVQGLVKIFSSSRIKIGGCYWHNGIFNYFYPEKQLRQTADLLAQAGISQPDFLLNSFITSFKKAEKLKEAGQKYSQRSFLNKSNEELISALKKASADFFDFYSYATIAPILGYRSENPLYSKMNQILKAKTKNAPQKFVDYLMILTAPPKKLLTNYLDLEILKLAKSAKGRNILTENGIKEKFRKEIGIVLQDVDEQLIAPTVFEDIAFSPLNYNWDEKKIAKESRKLFFPAHWFINSNREISQFIFLS